MEAAVVIRSRQLSRSCEGAWPAGDGILFGVGGHLGFLWQGGILYGELSIFTGNAHPQLARDICAYLGVPLGRAEVFEFSNENIFVKINQNVREHDVFVVQPTCSPVNKSVMELLIMLDALKRASASRITAV